MIRLKILAALLLCSAFGLQARDILRKIDPRHPEKDFESYVEKRKAEDVYITLPQNYTPIDVRGKAEIDYSLGNGPAGGGIDWSYAKKDIYAIIEDDSCNAAICFPESYLDFFQETVEKYKELGGNDYPITYKQSISNVLRNGKSIEADLRLIHNDMHLDIRPMITIIAEEDMSRYANADTAVIYEWKMSYPKSFMEAYGYGIGIYLMKKAHPAQLIRLMLNGKSIKDKDKYIRDVLDNIRFGDNPSEAFLKAEEEVSNRSDFTFPTKYRVSTGICQSLNDEVIEEMVRVKEWCDAHGIKELPKMDDELLEFYKKILKRKKQQMAKADSILSADIPEDQKILGREALDGEPYFPGEDKQYNNFELRDWVNSNLRFPKAAVKKGILKRRVVVDFVVCADGSIKNASVSHWDEDAEEYFKQEALRLVNSMPRWIPGTYKGKAVNAYASRPIWFEYDPKTKKQKVRTPTNPEHLAKEPVYDSTTIQTLPAFDPGEE